VIMLTTGKTLEESLTSLSTMPFLCAKTGKQELSSVNTKKDVVYNLHALSLMGGKSRSIILSCIRQSLAKIRNVASLTNVLSITSNKR
jgi:hypothetical protein